MTEREAVVSVCGLIVESCVCQGIIAGRPRLRVTASLSSLFDDVPRHKALNTLTRRLRGRVDVEAFLTEVRRAGAFRADFIS